jgi:hypothetical protein
MNIEWIIHGNADKQKEMNMVKIVEERMRYYV